MPKQKELVEMMKGKKSIPSPEPEEKKEEPDKKEKPEEEKEDAAPDVKAAFSKLPARPSQTEVEAWKAEYGNVYVSGFSDDEILVWRPLMRHEYRNLKTLAAQHNPPPTQEDQEEMVVEVCVLWPAPNSTEYNQATRKAGAFSTLYEQIMQASCFIHPGVAGQLVREL